MADELYIIPPEDEYDSGDVFADIPFPNIRGPFKRYRLSTKPAEKNKPEVFVSEIGPDKPGDIVHCTYQRRLVMLLSHPCELDKVTKAGANADRRAWSCAPVEPFKQDADADVVTKARQQRIRDGIQPNRFYIPENGQLGPGEFMVDLRRITPLPASFFLGTNRILSLSEDAKDDLYAQMGVNQSGYALNVEAIECPNCGQPIDPTAFRVKSDDDEDTDFE